MLVRISLKKELIKQKRGRPGSLLAVHKLLLNDEKSGPLIPTLFNIRVGAYSEGEMLRLIKEAGFAGGEIVMRSEEIGCSWITAEKV